MSHLTTESLAHLIDEAPDPLESAHLSTCAECRAELSALREQSAELARLPDLEPPPHAWRTLEKRLREEGLVQRRGSRAFGTGTFLRYAAALALFLAGGVAGAMLRGSAPGDDGASEFTALADDAASPEQAARAVRAAESAYLEALTRYAELSGGAQQTDPMARLAALESIVLTTRAALSQAPADPVINGYHLTALAQKEVALRQLAVANEPWY